MLLSSVCVKNNAQYMATFCFFNLYMVIVTAWSWKLLNLSVIINQSERADENVWFSLHLLALWPEICLGKVPKHSLENYSNRTCKNTARLKQSLSSLRQTWRWHFLIFDTLSWRWKTSFVFLLCRTSAKESEMSTKATPAIEYVPTFTLISPQ